MTYKEWIQELKVGDKFVTHAGFSWRLRVQAVTKITNKQIVAGDDRFWKNNGRLVGDISYHTVWMEKIDDDKRDILLRQKTQNLIDNIKILKLEIAKVRKIYDLLKRLAPEG